MKAKPDLRSIPIDSIVECTEGIRHSIDYEALEGLKHSIDKLGFISPITVSPISKNQYRLVVGYRRYLAAKELNLDTIPAVIRIDQTSQEFLTIHENLFRENLNPIEESDQIIIYRENHTASITELASAWGKSIAWIQTRLEILVYPQELRDAIEKRRITLGVAQKIMTVNEEWQRNYFIKLAIDTEPGIKEVDNWISTYKGMEDPLPDTIISREQIEERQKELATYTDCKICSNRTSMMEIYTVLICPKCADELQHAVEQGRAQKKEKPYAV